MGMCPGPNWYGFSALRGKVIIIIISSIINNVYYYGGTITKLYAAGPPDSVKSLYCVQNNEIKQK